MEPLVAACTAYAERPVTYIGFHRGANFRRPLVLTQRGPNPVFLFFLWHNSFLQSLGHGPMVLTKYATH